jgi:hypothetical protein
MPFGLYGHLFASIARADQVGNIAIEKRELVRETNVAIPPPPLLLYTDIAFFIKGDAPSGFANGMVEKQSLRSFSREIQRKQAFTPEGHSTD